MNRYPSWLIDDDHSIIFVDYGDRLIRNWRFVTVQGVGYYVPVLQDLIQATCRYVVDLNCAA